MGDESKRQSAATTVQRINQAWLGGRVDDLAPFLHPEIVMVFPGFSGRCEGRDAFLAGFHDFCQNAVVHDFRESDQTVDVAGKTAIISFCYEMIYERSAERYRATGRDLWVFEDRGGEWVAVWRTMLDMQESAA
jgi:Domain of unknown function (DUF4440)